MEEKQRTETEAREEEEIQEAVVDQPLDALEEEVETAATDQPPQAQAEEVETVATDQPPQAQAEEVETAAADQPPQAQAEEVETAAADQPPQAQVEEVETAAADQPPQAPEEAEEEAAEHPMQALLEEALNFRTLKQGEIIEGEIVSVTPTEVLVHVGTKSEGIVPAKELERLGREGLESLQPGNKILVYVVRPEDRDGNLILSIRRAEEEQDWLTAQKLYESGELYESQVAGFNRGGLIVRIGRLRGFVPASQLAPQHQGSDKKQPEERWARLVGEPIRVKVIEFNRRRKRLILSERAAIRQWREARKEELLEELRPGEVRHGVVSSLSDFGAFVDLGGADGLVHLSELSWNRSAKPRDVLQVGQEVDVYVLNVDRQKKRIALSLKRLEPEPWTTVESRYYVGQLVEGTITRLANFGAFALVNDEIEGLIHISELSVGRINHPQEVVHEGEKHVMRIIRIDPKRKRMGLSIKRVVDPAYADLDWRAELEEADASFRYDGDALDEEGDLIEGDEE